LQGVSSLILDRDEFFQNVKELFAPRLREVGFTGSGQHFRRAGGDVLHGLTFHGNKYGGSCFVELGMHLTFLPDANGEMIDPKRFTEIYGEFRWRLGEWNYAGGRASVERMVDAYFQRGEPVFNCFRTVQAFVDAVTFENLEAGELSKLPAHTPKPVLL